MDGILLIIIPIFLIPISYVIYVLKESFHNSDEDNTVNPNFKRKSWDEWFQLFFLVHIFVQAFKYGLYTFMYKHVFFHLHQSGNTL